MGTYFNENDAYPAQWLRNLWPDATVDDDSIVEVVPRNLTGFTRVHLFAGIGGWEYALDLAGWPRERPVWTGSCPCQPFSVAGKGKGEEDPRHLWPEMRRLISECRPPTIFGEQVASRAGREWLSGVRADLEALGYAVGAADLCAASAGAPHIRQRLFWVADSRQQWVRGGGSGALGTTQSGVQGADGKWQWVRANAGAGGTVVLERLADSKRNGFHGCGNGGERGWTELADSSDTSGLGDAFQSRLEGRGLRFDSDAGQLSPWEAGTELLYCLDGKTRRTQSGLFPLAARLPGDVGRIRAYGNSIVPKVAASFIRAFLETE